MTANLLVDAIEIAVAAHRDQVDQAGSPYILHPLRLLVAMDSDEARMVAVLHDVVEDSDEDTLETLRERGFSESVLGALDCVTHREGESYEAFIERIGKNPLATKVKLADLEDNMNVRRLPELTEKDLERLQRYRRSWEYLRNLPQTRPQ